MIFTDLGRQTVGGETPRSVRDKHQPLMLHTSLAQSGAEQGRN